MRPARSRYTPGVPNPSHFGGTPRSSWPPSIIFPVIHYLYYGLAPKPSAVCLNLPSCTRAPAGFPRSVANRKSAVSLPSSARTCDGRFSRTADSYPWHYRLAASPMVSWERGCISRRKSAPRKGARQCFIWLASDRGNPAGARRSDVKFSHSPNGIGATQKKYVVDAARAMTQRGLPHWCVHPKCLGFETQGVYTNVADRYIS